MILQNQLGRLGYCRHAAQARQSQPARKARPPNGVIAPSQRIPESARAYKLPEKMIVPIINSQPAAVVAVLGQRVQAHATTNNANA